jgi:CRISPR-associated protein Cmx8
VPTHEIELSYDPFALPTVQHRAGLAGLLVLIESMRRRKIKPLPEVSTSDDGRVCVRLRKESLQTLFDDLYDAIWEERKSDKKPQAKTIRNVRAVEEDAADKHTGRSRKKTSYFFEAVAPKVKFLDVLGIPALWLKLWREALFASVRGRDKQRGGYKDRANRRPVSETKVVWRDLVRLAEAKNRNQLLTADISSSLLIGAQNASPERVPFCGSPDQNLLLHFWPVVMGVYVLEVIDRDGKTKFVGYVLTLPDVSDLDGFLQDFPDTVAQLGNEVAGYRPRGAVISLPQEGGLEYLHHLTHLAKGKALRGELAYNVAGVEVYHLEKQGNNIQVHSVDRLAAKRDLLEKYEVIRGRYRDPLFRGQVILNLLREEPWYRGFDRVFAKQDRKRFISSQAERFSMDARRYFESSF